MNLRGHVAPSGITRYRGRQFGDDYRDDIFVTEFNAHKLYRLQLERNGATFRGRDEVFLSSTSTDTHFTDVLEDADGSLLVVDTGGWFLYGCPTSQIAKPNVLGAIYRIRRNGGHVPKDARGLTIPWQSIDNASLAELLDDERVAVRDRAIATLARRGDAAVDVLAGVLGHSTSAPARRNAVWTLCRMRTDAASAVLRRGLSDDDPSVRQTAVRSVGTHRDQHAVGRLLSIVTSDTVPLRREAATALGRIGDARAVPQLLDTLPTDGDRFLEHALIYALMRIGDPVATRAGLANPRPDVRRGSAVALDQMDNGRLTREEVLPLLDTSDVPLQRAALEIIAHHPTWARETTSVLSSWLDETDLSAERISMIRGALVAFRHDDGVQKLIARTISAGATPIETRLLLLDVMASSRLATVPPPWRRALSDALDWHDGDVVGRAVSTAAALQTDAVDGRLRRLAAETRRPAKLRMAAICIVAGHGSELDGREFRFLAGHLDADVSPVDRIAAAGALGAASLKGDQLRAVGRLIRASGPLEMPALLGAFEHHHDAETGMLLVDALDEAPGAETLSPQRVQRLLRDYPQEVRRAAEPILARLQVDTADQVARLGELQPALAGGISDRGRQLFFGKKAACFACHSVGDEGGNTGPNLSKIGEIRTRTDLLESIVFPSASLARGFESYSIVTTSGKVVTGLIGQETDRAVIVRTADRREVGVARDEIDTMAASPASIMPQGLDKTMSVAEIRDLLAFLSSLR